jgi:hypothetical protein
LALAGMRDVVAHGIAEKLAANPVRDRQAAAALHTPRPKIRP